MRLFIERKFIEALESWSKNIKQSRIYDLVVNYPQLEVFTDFEYKVNPYDYIKYETLEMYLGKGNVLPQLDDDISNNWDKYDLIFTTDYKNWFMDAKSLGVLCFTLDEHENDIRKIEKNFHYRTDLSETNFSWANLKFIDSSRNTQITDNYILVDTINQKIEENLIPLLNQLNLKNRSKCIEIYTIAQAEKEEKKYSIDKLHKKINILQNKFNNLNFKVFNIGSYTDFDFHDRIIMNNLQLVECGKGFNLVPHKVSNSSITSYTIFDLYTYKRIINLKQAYIKCSEKLNYINIYKVTCFPES